MGLNITADILNDWPYWIPIPIGMILIIVALFPKLKKIRIMLVVTGILLFILAWVLTNFY